MENSPFESVGRRGKSGVINSASIAIPIVFRGLYLASKERKLGFARQRYCSLSEWKID